MANSDHWLPPAVANGWSGSRGDGLRQLMAGVEGQVADGMEQFVAGDRFSELLVGVTGNTVAMWKLGADVWDSVWRGLRLPGRADIDRLAEQLTRTEDKLELLLQSVERLQDSREGV